MTEEVKTAKTVDEKIADLQARIAKLVASKTAAAALDNTQVGDDVDFAYGRAAKVRSLAGRVVALGEQPAIRGVSKVAVISVGEGLSLKNYKVRVADITANRSADARAEAEAGPADPLDNAE
jgi:hypothetical protein